MHAPPTRPQNTEGAFRDWGYKLAQANYRNQVVTERESWILGNKDKDGAMSVEANAKSIEPGYDMMTPAQQKALRDEVEGVLSKVRRCWLAWVGLCIHAHAPARPTAAAVRHARRRQVQEDAEDQGLHRRHHAAAGAVSWERCAALHAG